MTDVLFVDVPSISKRWNGDEQIKKFHKVVLTTKPEDIDWRIK